MPLRSLSKMSKAVLMSLTYSTGMVREAKSSALKTFFSGALGCCGAGFFMIGYKLIKFNYTN